MKIENIIINKKSIDFLESRWLETQYKKAKEWILQWNFKQVDFKLRNPKKEKVYYFRINKQYRAWGRFEENILKIFHIDDHS